MLLLRLGTLDITRDMTRQYKGMQEELLNRINQLEGTIQVRMHENHVGRDDNGDTNETGMTRSRRRYRPPRQEEK